MSAWTDERIELLKKLWSDGLSCSAIAAELGGITRNAVIGKADRLGLSGRIMRPNQHTNHIDKPRKKKVKIRETAHRIKQAALAAPTVDLEPKISANPIGFEALEHQHCRWPVSGAGYQILFCGDERYRDFSYCPRHCRMAYRPAERRSRSEQEKIRRDMLKAAEARAA